MEKFTIVLVDDDEDEFFFFNEALAVLQRNIALITCENGNQLLQHLNNHPLPDVIFLDINIPNANGFEMLKQLRSDERFRMVPVVMYSTSADSKDMEKAYAYGASLYLCKVVVIRDLPAKLELIIDSIQNNRPFRMQEFTFNTF